MSKITLKTTVDINFGDFKEDIMNVVKDNLNDFYGIDWCELEPESQEEILENVLQEFSK